jgi:hypothetical protein
MTSQNKAQINKTLEQSGKERVFHEHLLQQEHSLAWTDALASLVFIALPRKYLHQLISAKGPVPTRR